MCKDLGKGTPRVVPNRYPLVIVTMSYRSEDRFGVGIRTLTTGFTSVDWDKKTGLRRKNRTVR